MNWSIIDMGRKDFIRNMVGMPFSFDTYEKAQKWLLKHGKTFGWTNNGTHFYNWNENKSHRKHAIFIDS